MQPIVLRTDIMDFLIEIEVKSCEFMAVLNVFHV